VKSESTGDTGNDRATGTIAKSSRKYLSNTPEKHEIKKLQKAAILDTAHKLREVIM
jgi:hypothetical protein